MILKPRPLPCPCCGNKDLYVGKVESCTLGIECNRAMKGCGISMGRRYPQRMPKGIKTLEELDSFLLMQAIQAWNKRIKVTS